MKRFLSSLLSRKFLMAVGAIAVAVSNKQYEVAAGVAGAYILAEAHVDAKAAVAHVDAVTTQVTAASGDPRFQ